MEQEIRSKEQILALMRRLGMTDQLEDATAKLPDHVDLTRDRPLLLEFGLDLDDIVDRLGGSPW